MITAVDTNILIDIFEPDPVYGHLSKEALKKCLREGAVVACEVVWAEVAVAYPNDQKALLAIMQEIGIQFLAMNLEDSLMASKCWAEYLTQQGGRKRIAADFLIGGHALVQCDRLLTRDKGFYRGYFNELEIISPDA